MKTTPAERGTTTKKQKFATTNSTKTPTHKSRVRRPMAMLLRRSDCPSDTSCSEGGVSSNAWGASLLQQRHSKRARRGARHDRTPPSNPRRLRTSFHQCGCGRCLRLQVRPQELGRLIRPSPAHLSRKKPDAHDHLPQTIRGRCVLSSGAVKESCRSRIVLLLRRWTTRPPRPPNDECPSS